MVVADGAAGLSDELHAALVGALHVVAEGEESVAAQRHARILGNPFLFLFAREHLRPHLEELLPFALGQHVVVVVRDVDVNRVVAVGAADAVDEGQRHHLRMLPQPPDVGLVACQPCAVDAALLPCTDADGLSVLHVADGVRLRVLQRDERDDEVAAGILGECLVLRGDVPEESRVVETDLVAPLLEGDAEHLLALHGLGAVGGVNLDDVVRSLALLAQNLQGLFRVVGGDDAVGDLAFQQQRRGLVARVGQRHEVAVRAHAVGTAGAGIGRGDGRELHFEVIHEVDLPERVAQGQAHGGTGR